MSAPPVIQAKWVYGILVQEISLVSLGPEQ